jgi:hypothetical protein
LYLLGDVTLVENLLSSIGICAEEHSAVDIWREDFCITNYLDLTLAMPVKVCQSVKRTLLLSGPHLFTSVVCYSMSFLLIVCASPSPSPPSLFSMFFPLLCCAVVSF